MEQTLKLTRVDRFTTDKDGKPLISAKNSKPYERVRIKAKEHGDRFLSGFGGEWNRSWKEGDTVTVMVTEADKLDMNNQPYLNFSKVDKATELETKLNLLDKFIQEKVMAILRDHEERLREKEGSGKVPGTNIDYPKPEEHGLRGDGKVGWDEDGLDQLDESQM